MSRRRLTKRRPKLTAASRAGAILLWAASLNAQVPPGHDVGLAEPVQGTPAGAPPSAFLYEPLFGTVETLLDPNGVLLGARRVALGPTPNQLLVARDAGSGRDAVLVAQLQGRTLTGARLVAAPLPDAVVALWIANGSIVTVLGDRVLSVPFGGGATTTLSLAPAGDRFVDAVPHDRGIAALATTAAGASALQLVSGPLPQRVALPLRQPTALAGVGDDGAFRVGDAAGRLWRIDATRFASTLLGRVPTGAAVTALSRDVDRGTVRIGTIGIVYASLATVVAGGTGTRLPVGLGAVRSLSGRGYASTFTTYGAGCPGYPARVDAVGRPYPGNATFAVTLDGAAPAALANLLVGIAPASTPLGVLQMPGCTLLVQPFVALPTTTNAGGRSGVVLPVPADPNAAGVDVRFQWVVVEPTVTTAGLATTPAGLARF